FFFFQAEDGIRDATVTGVQTCALPISANVASRSATGRRAGSHICGGCSRAVSTGGLRSDQTMLAREIMIPEPFVAAAGATSAEGIGRASGRGDGERSGVGWDVE